MNLNHQMNQSPPSSYYLGPTSHQFLLRSYVTLTVSEAMLAPILQPISFLCKYNICVASSICIYFPLHSILISSLGVKLHFTLLNDFIVYCFIYSFVLLYIFIKSIWRQVVSSFKKAYFWALEGRGTMTKHNISLLYNVDLMNLLTNHCLFTPTADTGQHCYLFRVVFMSTRWI